MKQINKVIAAMMMMAITTTMPAMAGNKNHNNNDKKVVVVTNNKSASHFDKVNKALSHNNAHKGHAYRPDVKICTIKVNRHESYNKVIAKAENMKGVIEANWNPRTREVTVRYDAKVTSAKNIKRFMA
jgi:hypothetical protein